jgi:hypothetical protein
MQMVPLRVIHEAIIQLADLHILLISTLILVVRLMGDHGIRQTVRSLSGIRTALGLVVIIGHIVRRS